MPDPGEWIVATGAGAEKRYVRLRFWTRRARLVPERRRATGWLVVEEACGIARALSDTPGEFYVEWREYRINQFVENIR